MSSNTETEVIKAAVAYLNENAGKHKRARWHVDVEREPGELTASGFSGDLVSEDQKAIDADHDFVGDFSLDEKFDAIVNATNKTSPIATVDFTFERTGDGWTHKGFVHTVAERAALDKDRAELDGRLRELLQGMASAGWTTISFNYTWDKPLRIVRMVSGPEKLPPEGPAADLLADYQSFFAKRELELHEMRGVIKAKPKGTFELTLTYGVPHATKKKKK